MQISEGSQRQFQDALDEPLRSEQRIHDFFPRSLSRVDLLVIFLAIVLFIPNASVVQATAGSGGITYLYWILGTLTFLIPGALASAQLYRLMPSDGSLYVWTHRAMGPLFGFFAAFCSWFPGVLVPLATADTIITLVQGIGVQVAGTNANWLIDPQMGGLVVVGALVLVGIASALPLRLIMRAAKSVILLYCLSIALIGLAGFAWLLTGHAPASPITTFTPGSSSQNIVLYGVIVLALLGVEVPLNMAAEERERGHALFFLRWGPLFVLIAYLLGTFGVMAVVPPSAASEGYSTLTAVKMVFGPAASVIVGIIFIAFFFTCTIIYTVAFARILFVASLDYRLPTSLTKVNRHGAPYLATTVQILIAIALAIITYFVGPVLFQVSAVNFSQQTYNVAQATVTVIWCISMIFLFLDLPLLLYRSRAFLEKKRELLVAAPWLLSTACFVGAIASVLGIGTTLTQSWDPTLLSNAEWFKYVGVCSVICLVVGLLGSAYPRLLGSLKAQTEAARENARLYQDLNTAYEKLSQLDQLKDAFLTTASHELRTPLTIMQGYLELLGEIEDIDPESRRSFITKARRACDELVLLQANIMDASRIQVETASLILSDLPLKEAIDGVVDLFEPLILQQERNVEVSVPPNLIVRADETRLKQILRNLISNALRYSPEKTPLRIIAKVSPDRDQVGISVIDCGAGIPLNKQEDIFDKFVRLERDMHGITRGSGLGLYITRQLVEAMHGKITVESSGVAGEGSTFTFTLPLKKISTKPL